MSTTGLNLISNWKCGTALLKNIHTQSIDDSVCRSEEAFHSCIDAPSTIDL